MNTERLQDWLQILGIIGIIASLVFVGQQLKQDRHIAESEAWLSYVDTQVALSQLINENAKIWAEGLGGADFSAADCSHCSNEC